MPITYDKKRKRWRFEFNRLVNGQRHRATRLLPKGWDKAAADEFDIKETSRLYKIATGVQRPVALIQTAVNHYLRDKSKLKSIRSAGQHLGEIMWAYEDKTLNDLPEVAIAIAESREKHKGQGLLSDATVKQRLALLKAACRWGWKKHNLCDNDPTTRMQMPTVRNARHIYASRAEMLALCWFTPHRDIRIMIRAAFYTGMRLGELRRVRVVDGYLMLDDTKNGTPRAIPVHPRMRVLLPYLPLPGKNRYYQHQFKKVRDMIGLEHIHIHDLRHSTASEMINSGVDLYTVGRLLGHKDQSSTSRYAHLQQNVLGDAIGKVGRRKKV